MNMTQSTKKSKVGAKNAKDAKNAKNAKVTEVTKSNDTKTTKVAKAAKAKNTKAFKAKAAEFLKHFLVYAQGFASLTFLVSIFSLNIIDFGLLVLLSVAFLALLALSAIKLIINQKTPRSTQAIFALISVATIVAALAAFRYTDAANAFLNKITDQAPETKEYSVLVLKNSDYQDVHQLSDKSIGFLKTDPDLSQATSELKNVLSYDPHLADTLDNLTTAITTEQIPAIVLESSRYDALAEDEFPITKITKVIYRFNITLAKEEPAASIDLTEEPFIAYISGSDSRSGIKAAARSDVNILAVVNPKQHKILLVSIPRDSYVQLHDTVGIKDKLTHAGIYGINMSKTTIEDFLDVKIDYTIKVSFDTVVKVVDQLDGIDINSDQAMTLKTGDGSANKNKLCQFAVGVQHVDGDCALRFARERKSYATGDRHRGENQQQVITAIINKITTEKSYLTKLPQILEIAGDSFETSFSRDNITALIRHQLGSGQGWQTESIAIDGAGSMQPTYSMGSNLPLYVMLPDQASIAAAQAKIQAYLEK